MTQSRSIIATGPATWRLQGTKSIIFLLTLLWTSGFSSEDGEINTELQVVVEIRDYMKGSKAVFMWPPALKPIPKFSAFVWQVLWQFYKVLGVFTLL